ncbi:MAG: hypothetical protein KKE57_10180 [Proteobacteria bacterium]|nr:hypothetical protein [Pseudomonadota bacterium]
MKVANKLLVFGCLILMVGCGYHFRATGESIGIRIESLAIPMISSTSSEIGFEAVFTKVIREEFISHGKIPLVPEAGAHAVLIGRIHDIRTEALSFDSQQHTVGGRSTTHAVTNSRRLKVRLDMQLLDKRDNKVIWHDEAMEEWASFAVEADPLATRYHQQEALEKIARRLAKKIYLKTAERF